MIVKNKPKSYIVGRSRGALSVTRKKADQLFLFSAFFFFNVFPKIIVTFHSDFDSHRSSMLQRQEKGNSSGFGFLELTHHTKSVSRNPENIPHFETHCPTGRRRGEEVALLLNSLRHCPNPKFSHRPNPSFLVPLKKKFFWPPHTNPRRVLYFAIH